MCITQSFNQKHSCPRSNADIYDQVQYVAVQTVFSHMGVTKFETLHMVSQGDIVIVRGWADVCCKDTNKSGRLHYATTYVVKDGKIISYDEMTDSGTISANLVLRLPQLSHQSPEMPASDLTIEMRMWAILQPLRKPCLPSEGASHRKRWVSARKACLHHARVQKY